MVIVTIRTGGTGTTRPLSDLSVRPSKLSTGKDRIRFAVAAAAALGALWGGAPGAVVLLTPVYCGLMVIMTNKVLAELKGSFSELWFETWPILAATAAMAAVVLLRREITLVGAN